MILRERLGWPIERVKGRRILNFLRLLIHTDIGVTWRKRHEGWPVVVAGPNDDTCTTGMER